MAEASHNSPGTALTENSQLSASNPRPIFNEPEYLRIHHPPSDTSPSPCFPPSYPCEINFLGCGLLSYLRHPDQRRNTTHPRHRISNYPPGGGPHNSPLLVVESPIVQGATSQASSSTVAILET